MLEEGSMMMVRGQDASAPSGPLAWRLNNRDQLPHGSVSALKVSKTMVRGQLKNKRRRGISKEWGYLLERGIVLGHQRKHRKAERRLRVSNGESSRPGSLSANAKDVLSGEVGLVAEGPKDGVFLVIEVDDRVKLCHHSLVHNKNSVVIRWTSSGEVSRS
jgi:hypothetical protein